MTIEPSLRPMTAEREKELEGEARRARRGASRLLLGGLATLVVALASRRLLVPWEQATALGRLAGLLFIVAVFVGSAASGIGVVSVPAAAAWCMWPRRAYALVWRYLGLADGARTRVGRLALFALPVVLCVALCATAMIGMLNFGFWMVPE